MLRIEWLTSVKYPWTISTSESCSFPSSPSPSLQTHDSASVHVDLILPCRPLTVAHFSIWLVPLLAVSIDCYCNVEVERCKESDFLGSGQIASGDLSARTHVHTHMHTDKINVRIVYTQVTNQLTNQK